MNEFKKESRVKVAHVCPIDWTVQVLLKPQLLALLKDGYEVKAVCQPTKYEEALKEDGIEIVPIKINRSITPFRDLVALWNLVRIFRKQKFTIVHTHTPKVSLLGQLAAKIAGVPVIINSVHGFYFHDNMPSLKRKFYILMEKIAALFSDIILSQNIEDVQAAINLGICDKEKIRELGNGINLKEFDKANYSQSQKESVRGSLGINEEDFVVGIVGRMVREKGYLELFEAVANLRKKGIDISLLCIGPEEPEKEDAVYREDAVKLGLDSNVYFCGHRDDVSELMLAMDVFCLPSYREGYPRSAMEACAMELPVVATKIRGCRQVVEDRCNGILVSVGDPVALENAILELYENKDMRLTMAKEGRHRAECLFDENNVISIIKEEYKKALSRKGLDG